MKKMILLAVFLTMCLSPLSWAQPVPKANYKPLAEIPEETRELVRRLLEANGTRAGITRIFDDIITKAPPESQAELRSLLRSDSMIDQVIPVYVKHFTPEELRELITFYKSPTGSKNLKLTPVLMTEVMNKSMEYLETNAKTLKSTPTVPDSGKMPDK